MLYIINFNTLNKNYNAITINGIYTIIKSTDSTKPNNNTLIINFKSKQKTYFTILFINNLVLIFSLI